MISICLATAQSCLLKSGDTLTILQAEAIDDSGIESVKIRSVLTCETRRGVCAKCYGVNLANGRVSAWVKLSGSLPLSPSVNLEHS